MRMTEMVPSTPINLPRTTRRDRGRVLTSADAGKILPLKYIPMLREDAVKRGRVRVNLEMMETAELLMNGVMVNVMAHFVPMLAFERFNGSMEELNRSYKGETGIGGSVVPFFESNKLWSGTAETGTSSPGTKDTSGSYGSVEFYQTMGIHFESDFNTTIVEAYNAIVNHRRKARSASLPLRNQFDHNLAEAFWSLDNNHIVPDFDQKLIDGEVALNGLTFEAPIRSKEVVNGTSGTHFNGFNDQNQQTNGVLYRLPAQDATTSYDATDDEYIFADIWAELTSGGNATMSLADIDQAKKTAAFAKLRSQYDGIDDEYVIDMLMEGIRVPEEAMKQPILLSKQTTTIGYNQRYATDAANLDTSVTNGYATVDMSIRTPQMNTGGVIMVTAEIVPEQMWERKKDYFLYTTDSADLPNALADTLDPEQVSRVTNDHLDTNHSTPDGTFGYAPLNHEWMRDMVNVGGKYYRPADDAFDEDRAKIWTVETTDPVLNEDFYLVSGLHKKVFSDQVADAFEITCITDVEITGNTVFGERLLEADATSDYEAITNLVDSGRIDK